MSDQEWGNCLLNCTGHFFQRKLFSLEPWTNWLFNLAIWQTFYFLENEESKPVTSRKTTHGIYYQ